MAGWAARHTGPVHSALLVTPPYLDPAWTPAPGEVVNVVIDHVPRSPLPFRALLVASRNDPMTTFEQFEAYARDWGADLYDAGPVGHLDSTAGFDPGRRASAWPAPWRPSAS
ncbi:hypothetical protein GCM10007977_070820 [Dactylosporangium sucinum]|uniref:Esterase n=1 Tax=Dactylosporangium sucinum TaxID=1424081 RepID=A0A917U6S7_9ACTN|nr:hypothetical protein GCM10007977_070820 [Dactylosporangium sucinum]